VPLFAVVGKDGKVVDVGLALSSGLGGTRGFSLSLLTIVSELLMHLRFGAGSANSVDSLDVRLLYVRSGRRRGSIEYDLKELTYGRSGFLGILLCIYQYGVAKLGEIYNVP